MRLCFLAVLLLCAGTSVAADGSQRAVFRDALAAAQQGSLDARPDLRSQLQTYPLYNYLSAAELRYRLDTNANTALDSQIQSFISANPDLPPAESLRRNWLPSLARPTALR